MAYSRNPAVSRTSSRASIAADSESLSALDISKSSQFTGISSLKVLPPREHREFSLQTHLATTPTPQPKQHLKSFVIISSQSIQNVQTIRSRSRRGHPNHNPHPIRALRTMGRRGGGPSEPIRRIVRLRRHPARHLAPAQHLSVDSLGARGANQGLVEAPRPRVEALPQQVPGGTTPSSPTAGSTSPWAAATTPRP